MTSADYRSPITGRVTDHPIPLIVNCAAGTATAVGEIVQRTGWFSVCEVAGDQVAARTRAMIADGHRRIAVAGGDGTIGAAAEVLVGTDAELAVVPGGTLNHFARDHGVPADIEEALTLARFGVARKTDVARVNGRVFLNTSSVGAYVALVRHRDRLERSLGYTLASFVGAIRVFASLHRFAVEVRTPEETRLYRTPLLFVGVGERELRLPLLGSRVPGGRSGLHLMVVRGRTRGAIMALALAAATRGIRGVREPHLDAVLVDECTVTLREGTLVSTDGELVTLEAPLHYEMLRGALRLVRPKP